MDFLATFQPALQGWQTSDDDKLSIHTLHPPCSSSSVTLGCQQSAHEFQHHSVAFDYSLGFEQDCWDTPAFSTGRAFSATIAADRGPSVHGTPALPTPAVAAIVQHIMSESEPIITTSATGSAGAHGTGTAAQPQQQNQQESQSVASSDAPGNLAAQQQQTQQEPCHTALRTQLQISSASPRIKVEKVAQPVQQQHSHSAAAASLAVHHQTEVQQVKEEKPKTTERCKADTDRKLAQRLVHLKTGKIWLASGTPKNSSSGVTSCTTSTVSGCSISVDLESKCTEQHKATWVASAEKTAAAAADDDDDDDDDNNNVKLLSSRGYSQQDFWNYYIRICVLDPETNPKMHLKLPTLRPDLQLNGRNRRGKKDKGWSAACTTQDLPCTAILSWPSGGGGLEKTWPETQGLSW